MSALAVTVLDRGRGPQVCVLHQERAKEYKLGWSQSLGPARWQMCPCGEHATAPKWPAIAMAHDGKGGLFAVHNDPQAGALGYYAHREGYEPVAVPVAEDERILALMVAPTGDLHALTHHGGKLFYLSNRGGAPHREVVQEAAHEGMGAALAAAPDGGVHALYRDDESGGLRYMRRAPEGWTTATVEKGEDVGLVCCLRADRKGALHLCYSAPSGLRYATNRTGSWTCMALVDGTAVDGCDLVVDRMGFVHVCYADRSRKQMVYATNRPAAEDDAE